MSGRYRIQELLGEGGMGAVYLAEHTLMRKRVALKLLHPDMSGNEEVLARFTREAQAAANIDHPNVAKATDFGQTDDGGFFLVLEYIEGESLRHVLATEGAMPAARALRITRQIALALERAHGAGIVHRDLKPENVMLVKKGADPDFVKVLDFGIAKVDAAKHEGQNQPLTRLGTILGTPEYMSPEQAIGDSVGPGADLYALGVILYEMLTGKHPFEAADSMAVLSMHMIAPVPPMAERAPNVVVDPAVEAIARKLLEKEAKNRHESARALVQAIDALGLDLGDVPPASVSSPDLRAPVDAFAKTYIGTPAEPIAAASPPRRALPPLPGPLAKLPKNTLVALAIGAPVLVLGLVLVLVLALRGSSDDGRTKPTTTTTGGASAGSAGEEEKKVKKAGAERVKEATAKGPPALEALAKEYPDDPEPLRVLAVAENEHGHIGRALEAIRAMVATGAEGMEAVDSEIMGIVIGAAGVTETTDQAFALLEGALGAKGVDGLIELTQVRSSPHLRARATRALAKPDVRAKAGPAASVWLDMKSAKTCAAKHELLERAKSDGDGRLLSVLRPMKETRGCGFMGMRDCLPCLRKDTALEDAITAIEARGGK